ncbi:hypothetical protein BCP78_0055 [Bacillus phage BCP78]|uniref:Uncharacterized protein n=3 Tax=Tsarbombavirus BCP78 TaxID=1985182 RepID=J9PQY1_9CAUD|nr:hypothetical protein BCP78_0055 [Bacillus phage BCP78]YP_009783419.1 hypothetical protein QLX27_gp046 [Bacillus phage BCU4]AEW47062.1 hypothetical protein BCP78_0055 [Bacillus phage BCP78]AEW47552.1 hypothetical protein BCU4_0046 [Bacillus phage BCU4]AQN32429.1 hypothetical protein BCP12_006 [Bacillus phage BCP12]
MNPENAKNQVHKYIVETAIIEHTDRTFFLKAVTEHKDKLLDDGFKVEVHYQVVLLPTLPQTFKHFMYIEGRKLNEEYLDI